MATQTRALSTNHTVLLPPPLPAASPDWLTSQASIFRTGADGDSACRLLLAAALERIAALDAQVLGLQTQLWAGTAHAVPARTPSLRPAIRALLRERAVPMTAPQIEEALGSGGSLVGRLNEMVKAGQLTLDTGAYAFARDATAPALNLPRAAAPPPEPAPPPARRKGGRRPRAA